MLVNELMAIEKEITPIIMRITLKAYSAGVVLFISPKPTVVMVVMMK